MTGKQSLFRRRSTARLLFGLTAAGVALGVALPLAMGTAGSESASTSKQRRQIASMTAAERERLERLYAEYRALPEAERGRLRRLHSEIEQNPELKQTFAQYKTWLVTLNPWQRQSLREEQDFGLRLGIVQNLRQAQREERETRRQRDAGSYRHFSPVAWGFHRKHLDGRVENVRARWLRGLDLIKVMEVVRRSLPNADELQARFASEPLPVQHARILSEALAGAHSADGPSRENLDWPGPQLFDVIVSSIEDERDKASLVEERQRDPRDGQLLLVAMLGRSIDQRWEDDAESLNPSPEDRLRIYNNLESDRQTRVAQMSAPDRDKHLRWRFKLEKKHEFFDQISGLIETLDRIFPERMPRPSFGGRTMSGRSFSGSTGRNDGRSPSGGADGERRRPDR